LAESSIDRIPELFSVLTGQLSCVGPRPIAIDAAPSQPDAQRPHLKARPGILGNWPRRAMSGANEDGTAEDAAYASTWSLRNDIRVLRNAIIEVMNTPQGRHRKASP
jgi:exopolysaccharide production protein ExoY